jgi:hypothetical protein
MSDVNDPNVLLTDVQSAKIEEILPKLAALQTALEEQNPNIRNYLKRLNEDLSQYPDLVHILTDEQIKPIYSAMRAESQAFITTRESKKRGAKPTLEQAQNLLGLL